ncbi:MULTISPECIES: hypothetical protein, partial [unclassified Brevundimonas]|uniref:hypothetical protein n=1 Tax=unclassified Brevundimonas TaxID=2622653 RepID=UPI0025B9084F
MMFTRALLIAALIAVFPVTDAVAQSRDRDRDRYEQRDDRRDGDRRGGPQRGDDRRGQERRANPGDVARQVQNGRPGRMLGMRERGDDYTVRWEYPGGRVSDIEVDGRSGRPRGD